jgi:hypothetical protein
MKQLVKRVDQSPMNAGRWLLTLACGHELWVTSRARPKRQEADCAQCLPLEAR